MPQTSISLLDKTNLPILTEEVKRAMKVGVLKACESGVEWIKEDIFNGQNYVGSKEYPNVAPATQIIKAKKGKEKVGIMTGNLRDSFDTHYSFDGFTGTIRGGGGNNNSDYSRFLARWQIDKLFYMHRREKSKEIMEKEIKKAL
jgi:hypothetical protein